MKMKPTGRDYYRLAIATDPPVVGWAASFDGGQTFKDATVDDGGLFTWLIQGEEAPVGGSPVATLPEGRTVPVLRAKETQVIVERSGPPIDIE